MLIPNLLSHAEIVLQHEYQPTSQVKLLFAQDRIKTVAYFAKTIQNTI